MVKIAIWIYFCKPKFICITYFLFKWNKNTNIFIFKEIHNEILKFKKPSSCYNEHGMMLLYNGMMFFWNITSITNSMQNFTFQLLINTWEVMCVYSQFTNHPKWKYFISLLLETILQNIWINCPITVIGKFNIIIC